MKPIKVSDIEVAFPAKVRHLFPKNMGDNPSDEAEKFQMDWFFSGLVSEDLTPKDGINKTEAFRHLKCIQGSFEPKHEEKVRAVALLVDEWFEKPLKYKVAP